MFGFFYFRENLQSFMKNIYLLIIALFSFSAYSQFVHLKPNEEAPEKVFMVMNNNSTKTGYVKNNKMDYVVLRVLSQDANAFRHASVAVDEIQFKEEGSQNYIPIPSKTIKSITFSGDEPKRFDRINVYRFKKKSLEIKDKEPTIMFQTPKVDEYLVMYSNLYINAGRGGATEDKYNLFVRLKDSDKTYYLSFIPVVKDKHNLPQLKILAPNNKLFTDFIDQLTDKKSAAFKEYYELEKQWTDGLQAELKDYRNDRGKKLFEDEKRSIYMNAKYKFMFSYVSKKLEQFSN